MMEYGFTPPAKWRLHHGGYIHLHDYKVARAAPTIQLHDLTGEIAYVSPEDLSPQSGTPGLEPSELSTAYVCTALRLFQCLVAEGCISTCPESHLPSYQTLCLKSVRLLCMEKWIYSIVPSLSEDCLLIRAPSQEHGMFEKIWLVGA
jgi:hypothetical protein